MRHTPLILLTASTIAALSANAPADGPASRPALIQVSPLTGGDTVLQPNVLPTPRQIDRRGGESGAQPGVRRSLVREGTLILNRTGRLSRIADGPLMFAFDPDEQGRTDTPMCLLPNLNLSTMEAAAANSTSELRFQISGVVTEYNFQNCILINLVSAAKGGPATRPTPGKAPADKTPADKTPADKTPSDKPRTDTPGLGAHDLDPRSPDFRRPGDPSGDSSRDSTADPAQKPIPSGPADQVMKDLLNAPRPRGNDLPQANNPTTDATSGAAAVAPGAKTLQTLREGAVVSDRVGRLSHNKDGQPELTFEADGKNMLDPPMLVLPNLKLTTMEAADTAANRDLMFRVTGVVTEYKGRNCILLQKAVVIPDATRQF